MESHALQSVGSKDRESGSWPLTSGLIARRLRYVGLRLLGTRVAAASAVAVAASAGRRDKPLTTTPERRRSCL